MLATRMWNIDRLCNAPSMHTQSKLVVGPTGYRSSYFGVRHSLSLSLFGRTFVATFLDFIACFRLVAPCDPVSQRLRLRTSMFVRCSGVAHAGNRAASGCRNDDYCYLSVEHVD